MLAILLVMLLGPPATRPCLTKPTFKACVECCEEAMPRGGSAKLRLKMCTKVCSQPREVSPVSP